VPEKSGTEALFAPGSQFVLNILERAGRRRWSSEQIPPLAKWLQENQHGLDMIVAASRRSRFYAPGYTLLNDKHERGALWQDVSFGWQYSREATRCLLVRAMWYAGDGRLDAAWTDLFALLRLSAVIAGEPVLLESLVAYYLSGQAVEAASSVLDDARLNPEQARRILRDLQSLSRFSIVPNAFKFERLSLIDSLIDTSKRPIETEAITFYVSESRLAILRSTRIDWNAALIEVNRWFDRNIDASRKPTRALQHQAIDQLDNEQLVRLRGLIRILI